MLELVGLIVSLILLTLALLPVITFLRLGRLGRELEELAARVGRLEQRFRSAEMPAADVGAPAAPAEAPVAATALESGVPPIAASPASGVAAPGSHLTATAPDTPSALDVPVAAEAQIAADAHFAAAGAAAPAGTAPVAPVAPDAPDLESRIGGRGLLYAGVLVLLLGVSFFLKYAFDNAWITETGRVVLGIAAGIALIVLGLRMPSRDLAVFGQALVGTGLAVLYLAVFAAFDYYALVGPATAFAAMVVVTIAAWALADRLASQALAFIAVGGGFLTPFLVGGDEHAPFTMLGYDAILVLGTMALAWRHRWLALNAASYLMTFATILAWAARDYSADQWLRTLLFLTLFVTLFLSILRLTARVPGVVARVVTALLATAPVFYHVAAVVISAGHPPAIHIYLIAFNAAGLWLTADPHRPWIRLLVLIAGLAPLFGTATLPDGLSWLVPNVVTIVAVAALHTMAILDRIVRQEERLGLPDLLALHLTGLGLFATLYAALQPAYPDFRGGLALIVAVGAVTLWWSLQSRDRTAAINAVALAFTMVAIAVAVQFDGPVVTIGWAAEGAAVTWVGLRVRSVPFQFGGLALWALAALRLSDGYFDTPAVFTVLLNQRAVSTLFVVALGYALAWLFNRSDAANAGRVRAALHIAGSILTMMWITAEIQSYWDVRRERATAYLFEHMLLSLGWGTYGAILIGFGMRRQYPPVRYAGMTILAGTILKVFFYDLWELGGIYRVIGFMGFGALLILVSYLYQRRKTSGGSPPASARE